MPSDREQENNRVTGSVKGAKRAYVVGRIDEAEFEERLEAALMGQTDTETEPVCPECESEDVTIVYDTSGYPVHSPKEYPWPLSVFNEDGSTGPMGYDKSIECSECGTETDQGSHIALSHVQ